MRLRDAIASSLHLLVVLSYFSLAVVLFFLPRRLDWLYSVSLWLSESPEMFDRIGALFAALGLLFFLGFYRVDRGRYLRMTTTGAKKVSVNVKLIRQALEEHFKEHYPQILGADVSVAKSNRLKIALELSSKEDVESLENAEEKLKELLEKRFGYKDPLTLFVRSRCT